MEGGLNMDTALAIEKLVGIGVKYGGVTQFNTKGEYSKLRWEDERPQPTWAELRAKWEEIKDDPLPKTELELLREELVNIKLRLDQVEVK